jgi:hypothetical protein
MADPEVVLDTLAAGFSVEKTAKQFDLSVPEVREILRNEVERCRDGAYLREVWVLADRRLAAVEHKFYNKALEGDGDPQSAIVFVKTNERRSTLNGSNMPQSHVLQVISQPSERPMTTTDEIEAALDHVALRSPAQRALENKQRYFGGLTADEETELTALEAERQVRLGRRDAH